MSELSYYDDDLAEAIQSTATLVQKLPKLNGTKKTEQLTTIDVKMKEISNLKKGYALAIRQASNKAEGRQYREKLTEHSKKIESFVQEVKWARTDTEREGLFGKSAERLSDSSNVSVGNTGILTDALNIQNKAEKSLVNTRKMIQQSKDVANATVQSLESQSQQMVDITDQVMTIEDNLKRADKLVRTFARRMATDRVILCFSFLVFLGIAGIIIYSVAVPDQKQFKVPDVVKPPNPNDIVRRNLRNL